MPKSTRPNVVPAKQSALLNNAERAEQIANHKTKTGKPRWAIKDMCDFCHRYAYMSRQLIGIRKTGRKFMCEVCRFEDGKQDEAKLKKYLPCWTNPILMGKFTKKQAMGGV